MSLTLHLGVIDINYVSREQPSKQRVRLRKGASKKPVKREPDQITTGDVATIIEEKYGLMEAFYENNEEVIVDFVEKALMGTLESVLSGAPPPGDPFGSGTEKIEEAFKDFLSTREAERVGIKGTPTLAAKRGVNHRLKHPYAKSNPRRPSFIDTGLMQASFKAWVD